METNQQIYTMTTSGAEWRRSQSRQLRQLRLLHATRMVRRSSRVIVFSVYAPSFGCVLQSDVCCARHDWLETIVPMRRRYNMTLLRHHQCAIRKDQGGGRLGVAFVGMNTAISHNVGNVSTGPKSCSEGIIQQPHFSGCSDAGNCKAVR